MALAPTLFVVLSAALVLFVHRGRPFDLEAAFMTTCHTILLCKGKRLRRFRLRRGQAREGGGCGISLVRMRTLFGIAVNYFCYWRVRA